MPDFILWYGFKAHWSWYWDMESRLLIGWFKTNLEWWLVSSLEARSMLCTSGKTGPGTLFDSVKPERLVTTSTTQLVGGGGGWDSILLKIIPSCVFSSDNCDIWADLQRSWRFCWTVAGRRLREPLQWRAPMWSQHRGTDEWTQQVQPSLFWQYRKVPLKKTNAWADTLYTQLTTRSSACTPSVTIYLHLSMYVPCRGINSRGIQLHS